jgi:hypothetical protein
MSGDVLGLSSARAQQDIDSYKVAPDFINFYIDGQQVGRRSTNLENLGEPLHIIINYALRRPIGGEPFVNKGSPALEVEGGESLVAAQRLYLNVHSSPKQA